MLRVVLFEGADAALTEDDLLVAAGHDVLGAHDPLFDGVAEAALEQEGLCILPTALSSWKFCILRAPICTTSTYSSNSGMRSSLISSETMGIPVASAGLYHVKDALGLEALEGVGRGAGLVSAAAEEGRTAGLDALCDAEGLLFALDAAGPAMTAIFSLPPILTPPQSMTESAGWKRRLARL